MSRARVEPNPIRKGVDPCNVAKESTLRDEQRIRSETRDLPTDKVGGSLRRKNALRLVTRRMRGRSYWIVEVARGEPSSTPTPRPALVECFRWGTTWIWVFFGMLIRLKPIIKWTGKFFLVRNQLLYLQRTTEKKPSEMRAREGSGHVYDH
ncbi:uncharacterized protein LOC122008858 [Zingiber officinale]|uniref:uncharacterized protein LOC122008858 n=1 Tax=Zingiber officinale TaxID=94328 RepID=UPI001C4AE5C1|nr:uncharacterized protein LOC122008858 [Zingiber officinale]